MKSLFEYFLESLIEKSHLDTDMKFIESTCDENKELIFSDDYNNGKLLDLKNKNDFDDLFNNDEVTHYQIRYKDNILGVFGIANYIDMCDKRYENSSYYILCNQYKFLLFNKHDIFKDLLKNGTDAMKLFEKSIYVDYLQINQNIKKELDINNLAVIKSFFEKLVSYCKKNNIEFITANGKNDKVTKLYVSVGGFTNFKEMYNDEFKKRMCHSLGVDKKTNQESEELKIEIMNQLNSFVVKKI